AGERVDTGQEFRNGERLDQIIVTACTQTTHPIIDLAERTDDQGGRDDPVFPQSPNDGKPVDVREHAIDRHHGIFGGVPPAQTLAAVDGKINVIAACRKSIRELVGRLTVVLDDENATPSTSHPFLPPMMSCAALLPQFLSGVLRCATSFESAGARSVWQHLVK